MSSPSLAAIILAAGKGTRMRSNLPKVLHPIAQRPMIGHVLTALEPLAPERIAVVVAPGMEEVAAAVRPATTAVQSEALGTAHAVLAARHALAGFAGDVLVLYGDVPLVTTATLEALVAERRRAPEAAVVVLGMRLAEPGAYGRLVAAPDGTLAKIVEAADCTPAERAITLCNSGLMAADARHLFALLEGIGRENAKGEYYLTDIVAAARRHDLLCRVLEAPAEELKGVNSRADLAEAEAAMQRRLRRAAMAAGVSLLAPETVFFSADTRIGSDSTIGPFVVFGLGVTIGEGVQIPAFCHIAGATIGDRAIIGPFARLRPGAELAPEVHIGNFVEVKNARLARGVKANHLAYLGDSTVGSNTNVGAGTITCNYDGIEKFRTEIGENVFIGTNSSLVAPVSIGAGAFIAAGSVITEDVPADAMAIGRGRQVVKPGGAALWRARRGNAALAKEPRGKR
ncbi:MAG TPA: bifunctional UDP-N-acetylglucosamine diphosphorylase/glucosamine-1-phosphate N-acetyltransferase GlmU [Stellaceae bacterium]|nr:bifunctional UDP-N-acetylglucosamine diphosphorylase/glucosamine-1-phosphate N-acetyltransferase GlmU [Stellaceae bacterium]